MSSGHVRPSDDVAYLCHLLAPTEQYVQHHPAWRPKVGRKREQRETNGLRERSKAGDVRDTKGGPGQSGGRLGGRGRGALSTTVSFNQVQRNLEM